jgi:hypothetical protein
MKEKEQKAILINSVTREARSVTVKGSDGIKKQFGKRAFLEGNMLCQFKDNIYLQSWGGCDEYLVAPAFISTWNPIFPMHGLAVIDACDINTGDAVDCPISAEDFLKTIEWEDAKKRVNPKRPNSDWIKRFHVNPSAADIVIQYGDTL